MYKRLPGLYTSLPGMAVIKTPRVSNITYIQVQERGGDIENRRLCGARRTPRATARRELRGHFPETSSDRWKAAYGSVTADKLHSHQAYR